MHEDVANFDSSSARADTLRAGMSRGTAYSGRFAFKSNSSLE